MEKIQHNLKGFADFIHLSAEKKRFYIVGHGKSGTTWFSGLLAAHPQNYVLGERKLFEKVGDYEPLLNPLLHRKTFLKWFQHSAFGAVFPEEDAVRYELARINSDYLLYRHIVQAHLKGWNPSVSETLRSVTWLGEKIALGSLEDAKNVVHNLKQVTPGCKLLHIVRDGRDTAISLLFHLYREFTSAQNILGLYNKPNLFKRLWNLHLHLRAGSKQKFYQNCVRIVNKNPHDSTFFYHFAHKWQAITNYLHIQGQQEWGKDYLLVKYEDLLAAPQQTVSGIFDFLDISIEEALLNKIIQNMSFESITGRKPGEQDIHNFYRKGVAGDWKNYFNMADKAAFKEGGGHALVKYGYELDDIW